MAGTSAAPMKLERGDWRANAVGLLEYAQKKSPGSSAQILPAPELTGGSHGLGHDRPARRELGGDR